MSNEDALNQELVELREIDGTRCSMCNAIVPPTGEVSCYETDCPNDVILYDEEDGDPRELDFN